MNSPSYFILAFGRLGEAELFIKRGRIRYSDYLIQLASILYVSVVGKVFKD